MKYLKYALYALVGIAVATGAVLAYIAATFDPNAYKDSLTRAVAEKTGRSLTLAGDIRLTLFPKVGLGLGRTQLSEAHSSEAFVAVNDVRIALAVIPLLSRRVVVDEIVVDGLRARLVRRADGTLSIDDLLGRRGESAAPADKTPDSGAMAGDESSPPVELDIQGIRVSDAALTWIDEQAGATYELSELSLQTGRVASGVTTDFEFSATAAAAVPALDLRTRATGRFRSEPGTQSYAVDALQVLVGGSVANIRDIDATLKANIRMRSARYEIDDVAVELRGAVDGERFTAAVQAPGIVLGQGALAVENLLATLGGRVGGIALSSARLSIPHLHADLDAQRLQVEGVSLTAGGDQGANRVDIALEAPRLDITADKAGGQDIVATLKANGPQLAATAGMRLTGVEGSGKALRIGQLSFDVDARQADRAVKGRLATPVSADLQARRFDLPALAGKFEVRSQALPGKNATLALRGSAGVDALREQLKADLALRFDESNIKARLGMANFASPAHTFDIAIDRLDVDRYRPASSGKTAADDAGDAGRGKETPFDLSPLKALHLDGTLRIDQLIASRVKASKLRLEVKARGGKLEINPLTANLYEGVINGTVAVDANRNEFSTRQKLTGVAIGPLLRDALERDLLEGRGSIGLDLNAVGNTVDALKRSLGGTADVLLRDGAIKGINLGQSLRSAKNLFSAAGGESAAASTQQTDFSEMTASFTIRNGKAHNEDLEMKSPFVRLSGAGDIDIAGGALDYVAKTSLVASSAGQGGKPTGELAGVTVPLRVTGPFDALKFKLDFSHALTDANRQKLEQKKDALKQKLESQVTDKWLGGKATQPPAEGEAQPPEDGSTAAPAASPEQELKKRLKNLLR